MQATIWKYPFEVTDRFQLELPSKARLLSVQVQQEQPCLWVLFSQYQPLETRRFALFGTGHLIENVEHLNYVGTFQFYGSGLVFHLFEEI